SQMTRSVGWLVAQPFDLMRGLLADGFTFYRDDHPPIEIPPLPWLAIAMVWTLIAWRFGSTPLAVLTGITFVYFAVFDLWQSAMMTLASVMIAVVIGTIGGILLGLWGYRSRTANAVLQPLYDIMQTLPLFSYLVPMILFFGFGPIAALMATVIFALPPMARVTTQALRDVPASIKEFGQLSGCTRFQLNGLVLLPAARKKLLLGVNQVIMLSLAVVIIASLIGAGGLGGDVLRALKSLKLADAALAGAAITLMAIMLDRLSYAIAMRRPTHDTGHKSWHQQHFLLLACSCVLLATMVLSPLVPALHTWPESYTLSPGRMVNDAVQWFGTTFKAELAAVRDSTIVYILRPTKTLFLDVPWLVVVLGVGMAGFALGGWRLFALGSGIFLTIAVLGYWDKAMISLYLVFLAIIFAMIIGFMLGLVAGLSTRANAVLMTLVDFLQTLPTFVYLIPVVMLFSIGDFPAFLAIVLYAIAPAIRYTAAGLRGTPQNLVDGARMSGCSRGQVMTLVNLPLALPTVLLGLNQVVMMSFGMLVVTALIGTRGLEEITLAAIARVDAGSGLLAGLCIAGMAIVFDRYIKAGNRRLADILGMPTPKL
ncbi:MAG: ABC transporter permease subunit, partial [Pseudomonadota bacterium]